MRKKEAADLDKKSFPEEVAPESARKDDSEKPMLDLIDPEFFKLIYEPVYKEKLFYHVYVITAKLGFVKNEKEFEECFQNIFEFLRSNFSCHNLLIRTSYAMKYGLGYYGRGNWLKGMQWSRLVASALRHAEASMLAGDTNTTLCEDTDSGNTHFDHYLGSLHMLYGNYLRNSVGNDLFVD